MPHLPVPTVGGAHHPLRPHLLLALHAALPEPERAQLVQVSHLLRGRPHGRPEEVRPEPSRCPEAGREGEKKPIKTRVSSCSSVSVVAMETRQYVVGDVITMRLMRREKGSLVAMPSSQWEKVEEPVRFGGESRVFSLLPLKA